MDNVKLLPCPLCGSEARVVVCDDDFDYYEVDCTNLSCDVYLANGLYFNGNYNRLHHLASYEEAVSAWNRLAEEPVRIIGNSTFASSWVVYGTKYKWIDENGNPVAEFAILDSCLMGGISVTDLKVYDRYRGKGLSYKVLDCAVKKCGANHLAVKKNNHIAKHVYDKYGFEVVDEDSDVYYMSYIEH